MALAPQGVLDSMGVHFNAPNLGAQTTVPLKRTHWRHGKNTVRDGKDPNWETKPLLESLEDSARILLKRFLFKAIIPQSPKQEETARGGRIVCLTRWRRGMLRDHHADMCEVNHRIYSSICQLIHRLSVPNSPGHQFLDSICQTGMDK